MVSNKDITLPHWLPVLPLVNTVIFPNAALPLTFPEKILPLLKEAEKSNGLVLALFTMAEKEIERPSQLAKVGVVCTLSGLQVKSSSIIQLVAQGLFRFQVDEIKQEGIIFLAQGKRIEDVWPEKVDRLEVLTREIKQSSMEILNYGLHPNSDNLRRQLEAASNPSILSDFSTMLLSVTAERKQKLLEEVHVEARVEAALELLIQEKQKSLWQSEINTKVAQKMGKEQREHWLREHLKTVQEELGEETTYEKEIGEKVARGLLTPEAEKVAMRELARLKGIPRHSPEIAVVKNYLEWIINLPWVIDSKDPIYDVSIGDIRKILDKDHFGLMKVKTLILEYLASYLLSSSQKGHILCLVGPPGVGKTSLAKSIAEALHRPFARISLGGLRDEAEIRGHRRTYIGAMPGKILQALRRTATRRPLLLLDEIDKLSMDYRGDPSSALLEVLDPETHSTFLDHFLDIPFDLSSVFFVTTANSLQNVHPALLDRLEVLEIPSYTAQEKMAIAKQHLIPKLYEKITLPEEKIHITDEAIQFILENYTREAGVRNLQRELEHLFRNTALKFVEQSHQGSVILGKDNLGEILGPPKFTQLQTNDQRNIGMVTGLAWTAYGGEILRVEACQIDGKGDLILTGRLGETLKESAQIALTLVRSRFRQLMNQRSQRFDYHIHIPSSSTPKDGPSAGTAIFLALASLITERTVSPLIGFSGEITLQGEILPVGGIVEKCLSAHRMKLDSVCLPKGNQAHAQEIPKEVLKELPIRWVSNIDELLEQVGLNIFRATAPESISQTEFLFTN